MAQDRSQSGFGVVEILLVMIVIVLTAGVGIYGYNTIKDDEDSKTSVSVAKSSATTGSTVKQAVVELEDLGIKFKKTDGIKNLTYHTDPSTARTVYVHDTKYDELVRKCGGSTINAVDGSIAGIVARDGTFNEDEVFGEEMVKQFDGFYITIGYPNGGSPCTDGTMPEDMVNIANSNNEALLQALKASEKL